MHLAWKQLLKQRIIKPHTPSCVNLVWVHRRQSKAINLRCRGHNTATDVLSFTFVPAKQAGLSIASPKARHRACDSLHASAKLFLGELVLCPDVIKKTALKHKFSFRAYALYCVLHGCLHLLGFEHEDDGRKDKDHKDEGHKENKHKAEGPKAKAMFALQDQLFELIA